MILLAILAATLAGGLLSVLLAALLVNRLGLRRTRQLLAFAAGVMLSAACLDILPEAQEAFSAAGAPPQAPFVTLLAGLLLFFWLERLALWYHRQPAPAGDCSAARSAALLNLTGDGLHNLVDGVLIAAAFLSDTALGVATTVAVVAHEIPQELGDFVLLLNAGWSRRQALLANAACSLTALVGGLAGYAFLNLAQGAIPYVLTLSAASFLYISVADLLPLLHRQLAMPTTRQAGYLLAGVAVVPLLGRWLQG